MSNVSKTVIVVGSCPIANENNLTLNVFNAYRMSIVRIKINPNAIKINVLLVIRIINVLIYKKPLIVKMVSVSLVQLIQIASLTNAMMNRVIVTVKKVYVLNV